MATAFTDGIERKSNASLYMFSSSISVAQEESEEDGGEEEEDEEEARLTSKSTKAPIMSSCVFFPLAVKYQTNISSSHAQSMTP